MALDDGVELSERFADQLGNMLRDLCRVPADTLAADPLPADETVAAYPLPIRAIELYADLAAGESAEAWTLWLDGDSFSRGDASDRIVVYDDFWGTLSGSGSGDTGEGTKGLALFLAGSQATDGGWWVLIAMQSQRPFVSLYDGASSGPGVAFTGFAESRKNGHIDDSDAATGGTVKIKEAGDYLILAHAVLRDSALATPQAITVNPTTGTGNNTIQVGNFTSVCYMRILKNGTSLTSLQGRAYAHTHQPGPGTNSSISTVLHLVDGDTVSMDVSGDSTHAGDYGHLTVIRID